MTAVLFVKGVIIGIMWTLGWIMRFIYTSADVSPKNLSIAFAPWITIALYFLLFWW